MSALLHRLEELSALGRHAHGIDRALATPQERAARECFARWATQGGFSVAQDAVGNVFVRRRGTNAGAAPILTGSHLDTVPTGGAYDGAYGVVGALCALELLERRGIATQHPIEAVAWAGEEGSRFPLGCLGSSVFTGVRDASDVLALCDSDGIALADALRSREGGVLDGVAWREPQPTAAYVELHVEQGPVLEGDGARLGVVTSIAGQRRYRVQVEGESGHAGTVPMSRRRDALCAAAEMILALESAARTAGEAVATVGRVCVEPGGTNVIPLRAVFSVDIRCADEEQIASVEDALREQARHSERERGVRADVETLESRAPAPMDPQMREALHRAIASLSQRAIDLPSGAGHDAMCLARIAPAAMIFVPSIGGCSHVAQERTADADLELGVEALAAALVEVDRLLVQKR